MAEIKDYAQFGFSTLWNGFTEPDVETIVSEIAAFGLKSLVLCDAFSQEQLNAFEKLQRKKRLSVIGLKNYLPKSEDSASVQMQKPELSSGSEAERREAVNKTKKTIEAASRLRASIVIVNPGNVAMEDRSDQLKELIRSGKRNSFAYSRLKGEIIDERSQLQNEHFDSLCTSVSELTKTCKQENIVLNFETPTCFKGLPNLSETEKLLHYFKNENVSYWHDTANAYIQEMLGFYRYGAYIEQLFRSMSGVNLTDVTDFVLGQMPCHGEFDFIAFESFVSKDCFKVIQVISTCTPEMIRSGLKRLSKIFPNREMA